MGGFSSPLTAPVESPQPRLTSSQAHVLTILAPLSPVGTQPRLPQPRAGLAALTGGEGRLRLWEPGQGTGLDWTGAQHPPFPPSLPSLSVELCPSTGSGSPNLLRLIFPGCGHISESDISCGGQCGSPTSWSRARSRLLGFLSPEPAGCCRWHPPWGLDGGEAAWAQAGPARGRWPCLPGPHPQLRPHSELSHYEAPCERFTRTTSPTITVRGRHARCWTGGHGEEVCSRE